MSTPKRPPHRLPAEAVGQWRLLRSNLNDLLTRLFIATIAVGGLIVADVSHSGTRPMEKVGAIAGGIFIVLAILALARFHHRFRQLCVNPGPLATAIDATSETGSDDVNRASDPNH